MATFNGSFFADTITPAFKSPFVTPFFITPNNDPDVLNGFEANDTLDGGGGNDTLNGGAGDDLMTDVVGDNVFNGEDGNDSMSGGFGNDVMDGGLGNDTINGSGGNNSLRGGSGNDLITAGSGVDTIDGGTGVDTMRGGDGSDFYFVDSALDVAEESFTDPLSGDDTVQASVSYTLSSSIDNLFLIGAAAVNGTGNGLNNRIVGNALANTLLGLGGNDTLTGLQGNDTLEGGPGDDSLLGGDGVDILRPGEGNDTLDGGNDGDGIDLNARTSLIGLTVIGGAGDDGADLAFGVVTLDTITRFTGVERFDVFGTTVQGTAGNDNLDFRGVQTVAFGAAFALTANGGDGADLIAGSTASAANDTLNGQGGDDVIFGQGGADSLLGGTENDSLSGGVGNDTLRGDDGDDTLDGGFDFDLIDGGAGTDTVDYRFFSGRTNVNLVTGVVDFPDDFSAFVDTVVSIENVLMGSGNDTVTGSAGANRIEGGSGNDSLNGGTGGNDTLFGDDGNDTINGGGGSDSVFGGAGDDLIFAVIGVPEFIDGGIGVDTLDTTAFGGSYAVNLATGATNFPGEQFLNMENLISGAGADTLTGSAANNRIEGGNGNDRIIGSAGNDSLIGGAFFFDTVDYSALGTAVTLKSGGIVSKGALGTDTLGTFNVATGAIEVFERVVGATGLRNVIDGTSVVGAVNQTVNLAAGTFSSTVVNPVGGFAAGATFGFQIANFTDVLGTNNNDTVTGNAAANFITGAGGSDLIIGSAGADSLQGGAGVDTMDYSGLGTAVTLKSGGLVAKGALGTDTLGTFNVATGAIETFERVVGAAGLRNVIDGTSVVGAVNQTVNLETGSFSSTVVNPVGGFAAGATFGFQIANFVDVLGTNNNDTVTGDAAANLITGAGGNDSLGGGSGNDTIDGGAGNDTITGGAGDDSLSAGLGTDTASYQGAAAGVTVDLQIAVAQNTIGAGVDTLSGFERLTGSLLNDNLLGDGLGNILAGSNGDDALVGRGGADTLIGGVGADIFRYFSIADSTVAASDRIGASGSVVAFEAPGAVLGDRISVSAIDADTLIAGNQAFLFGGTGIGRLWTENDAGSTDTFVLAEVDNIAGIDLRIRIEDGVVLASAYTAADFIL